MLLALSAWGAVGQLPDTKLHLVFCDVGQGDAILASLGSTQMLIDGGPTQLKTAGRYAKNLPIISLAKQEEKIYLPDQIKPLKLSKKSPELQLLQRIRDEAHRFAINYHRKLRDEDLFN